MRDFSVLLAAIGFLVGIGAGAYSTTAQVMTGEHAATLACAGFLFAIALGVWHNNTEKHQKRMEEMMIDLIRRQPMPSQQNGPYTVPTNPTPRNIPPVMKR